MTLPVQRELLLFVVLLVSFPASVLAQVEDFRRVELFAGLGWGRLNDSQGTLGSGTDTAVGTAIFIVPRLSAGVELNRTVHSGLLPLPGQNRRSDGRVTFASFKTSYYPYRFSNLEEFVIAPYVTGGIGMVVAERENRMQRTVRTSCSLLCGGSFQEITIGRDNIGADEIAFNAGGGLDLGLSSSVSL